VAGTGGGLPGGKGLQNRKRARVQAKIEDHSHNQAWMKSNQSVGESREALRSLRSMAVTPSFCSDPDAGQPFVTIFSVRASRSSSRRSGVTSYSASRVS